MWEKLKKGYKKIRSRLVTKPSLIEEQALPNNDLKVRRQDRLPWIIGLSFFILFIHFIWASFLTFLDHTLKTGKTDPGSIFTWHNFFRFWSIQLFVFYVVVAILLYGLIKTRFHFGSNRRMAYGQFGDSRLTTLEELENQYVTIPDRPNAYPGHHSFPGYGGVPVSHYKDKYFIDTDTVNTCVVGTSRSGKGELIVTPMIDILSRAEEQSSLIINDPKGELCAASKELLEDRGYDVEVLNIENPLFSMSYNPLELVKQAWIEGDPGEASKRANSLSYMIYHRENAGDNAFFDIGAQNAMTAIILSLVEYCVEHKQEEKITMANVSLLLNELGTINWTIDKRTGKTANALDEWFAKLPTGHIAKKRYGTTSFAGGKARGSILAVANNGLEPFLDAPFAQMTSRNSFDLKKIGFPKYLYGQLSDLFTNRWITLSFLTYDRKQKKTKIIKSYRQKVGFKGHYSLNFDELDDKNHQALKTGDYLYIQYDGKDRHCDLVYRMTFTPGQTKVTLTKEEKLNTFPDTQTDCVMRYSNKPTAVFMIIPDYDTSNHILASMFIRQAYMELAQNASRTNGNRSFKRVHFILDEFGNLPPIDSMDNILTVSLGRNILFNLFIQSFNQIKTSYGEAYGTIKENCQNWIYIMSKDQSTIQEFSDMAGKKTVISFSTNNETYARQDRNLSRSGQEVPVITTSRLTQLYEGEDLVIRSLHRQKTNHDKVRPFPIFNSQQRIMPYRYEFLSKWIDTSRSLNEMDIHSKHDDLDLTENQIDVSYFIVNEDAKNKWLEEMGKKESDTSDNKELQDEVPEKTTVHKTAVSKKGDKNVYDHLGENVPAHSSRATVKKHPKAKQSSRKLKADDEETLNRRIDQTIGLVLQQTKILGSVQAERIKDALMVAKETHEVEAISQIKMPSKDQLIDINKNIRMIQALLNDMKQKGLKKKE